MKFFTNQRIKLLPMLLGTGMLLSPTLAQTPGGKNVFANGSFDKLDKAGKPTGWSGFSPNAKVVKEARAGGAINHYVVVAPNHKRHAPFITSQLPLKAQWKTLRISARMKATKVKMGAQGWQGPRLSLNFKDANGKTVSQTGGPRLSKDSNWKTISQDCAVPKNAKTLEIQVAVFGPRGEFSVDDIKVVPNPS
jgi:hypothetical protein